MYRAKFVLAGEECECEADTLEGIVSQLCKTQDLYCLIRMGLNMGMATGDDKPVLRRLKNFMSKYDNGELKEKDIRDFNYSLSLGNLECIEFSVL